MTTLTIRVTSVCGGQSHLRVAVTGDFTRNFEFDIAGLHDMDADEAESFVRAVLFLAKRGRTMGQLRTLLQNGVTVTV